MRIKMTRPVTPAQARESGVWFALIMLLAYHFFEGGLQNHHVFISLGAAVGFWAVFRYLTGPATPAKAERE